MIHYWKRWAVSLKGGEKVKSEVKPKQIKIIGYIATGRDSQIITHPVEGRFIEQIAPKAFERALGRADDVPLLLNHKKDKKLASIKQRNLQLYENSVGLVIVASVDNPEIIQRSNELYSWSFGLIPLKTRYEEVRNRTDGVRRRIIEDMKLTEVSILDKSVKGLYKATSLEVRTIPFSNFNIDSYFEKVKLEVEILKLRGGIR